MSLTAGMVSWMNANGYSGNATAAKACEIEAPWPLDRNDPFGLQVAFLCAQICDYCAPSTTTTTTTTSTTATNRRK